jgi:hypothetical protein
VRDFEVEGIDSHGALDWYDWSVRSVEEYVRQVAAGRRSMHVVPATSVRVETWTFLGELRAQAMAASQRGDRFFGLRYAGEPELMKDVLRSHAQFGRFIKSLQSAGEFDVAISDAGRRAANAVNLALGRALQLAETEIPIY